jgi:hypothetical protein
VRHPRPAALDSIEPVLEELRRIDGLTERRRGVFYRRTNPFLHFHEDPTGMYADLKLGPTFERQQATDPDEQAARLARVRRALAPPGTDRRP